MPQSSRNQIAISAYDSAVGDFFAEGGTVPDLDALTRLAGAVAADVDRWGPLVDRLDHAAKARLDRHRAATVVLETVFDEVLTATAWRAVLATLALTPRPA